VPVLQSPVRESLASATVGPGRTGAASRRLEQLLTGPLRPAQVRAVFPSAVYLDTGDAVVALVTRDAVRLPIAVVLPATVADRPFAGVTVGAPATVGGGYAFDVAVHRWWTPRRPPALVRPEHLPQRASRLARALLARRRFLSPEVASGLARLTQDAGADRALALVGLGAGLTPAGDDVLGGVLLATRHLGRPSTADRLWAVLAPSVRERTTALSAALLAAAADGDAVGPAVGVLAALAGHAALEPALDRLLAVGASSGSDLAHGLLAGARAVAA